MYIVVEDHCGLIQNITSHTNNVVCEMLLKHWFITQVGYVYPVDFTLIFGNHQCFCCGLHLLWEQNPNKQSRGLCSQSKYFQWSIIQLQVFLVCHKSIVTNFILLEARQEFFRIRFIIYINVDYLCAAPLTHNVVSVNVIMLKLFKTF